MLCCCRTVILLFLFLAGLTGTAQADTKDHLEIDLSGTWMIRLGDDPSWSGVHLDNPRAWKSISLPGYIAKYSIEKTGRYIGVAWIRKNIYIPHNWAGEKVGVCLGRISHADVTYFNGVPIGETGQVDDPEMSMWYTPRFYVVPPQLIKPGAVNVISVKVWYHTYGDVLGKLFLSDYAYWQKERNNQQFLRVILNFIAIASGIPLFIFSMIFYIRRRKAPENLYQGLQLLFCFFIMLDCCSLWRYPGGIDLRYKILAYSWMALNVFHPMFLHRLYYLKRDRIKRLFLIYLFATTPLFILVSRDSYRFWGVVVLCVAVLTGFYNLTLHSQGLSRKRPYSKLFATFGLIAILGSLHDGMIYASKLLYFDPVFLGYRFDMMIFPSTVALLFIGTSLVLIIRFFYNLKRNEKMNRILEDKVAERTRSLIAMTEELEKQNIQFEEMAIRDSLTGLYNHAALCDRLDEMFMTSRKQGHPIAVTMLDVDDFKGVNDAYGHQVGDKVLTGISDILKSAVREYDFLERYKDKNNNRHYDLAGRYGGDEFMLVLPRCDNLTALSVLERIITQINAIRIEGHPGLRVNTSLGMAVLNPETACPGSDRLISLADIALYKSKTSGKNRISCKIYEDRP